MKTLTASTSTPATLVPPRSNPIKLWAPIGFVCVATSTCGILAWLFSGPEPTPPGPDPFIGWRIVVLRLAEVISLAVTAFMLWKYLFKSLVQERRLTFDGMFILALLPMYFMDVTANYFNFSFAYNAHFVNLGSWANYVPGFEAPRQHLLPEPLLYSLPMYTWWLFGEALFGCFVVRKVRSRFPTASSTLVFAAVFIAIFVVDFIGENILIRAGHYSYAGVVGHLTLWAGSQYQFPIYESAMVATLGVGFTYLRYFRDDKGLSFVERGVESLHFTPRLITTTRYFAVAAFVYLFTIVGYFLPYNFFAMQEDTFADLPSYLRAGICGEGTDYACPGREVPVPSRSSIHLKPDDPALVPVETGN